MNEVPTLPEAPPEVVKPRFGRKLYLVIGLAAIIVITSASIIMLTQFLPGARGEAVPLGLNYDIGEKMTYEISITVKTMDQEVSEEGIMEMEVQNFDGENYTIRETMTFEQQEFSFTVKMNQTGHITEYVEIPPELQETFSSFLGVPGFGSYFTKEEVRVGESWKIPLDMEVAGVYFEGTINYKLSEIANVTVPAGTYEVLKISIKASDIQATSFTGGTEIHVTSDVNGYIYLENATCRPIEYKLEQSLTMKAMGQTESMEISMQTKLIEHLK